MVAFYDIPEVLIEILVHDLPVTFISTNAPAPNRRAIIPTSDIKQTLPALAPGRTDDDPVAAALDHFDGTVGFEVLAFGHNVNKDGTKPCLPRRSQGAFGLTDIPDAGHSTIPILHRYL